MPVGLLIFEAPTHQRAWPGRLGAQLRALPRRPESLTLRLPQPASQLLFSLNAARGGRLDLALEGEATRPLASYGPRSASARSPLSGGLAVDDDVITLDPPRDELRLKLSGDVAALRRLALSWRAAPYELSQPPFSGPRGWGWRLPQRSQRRLPGDGHRLCSPSSLAMVCARLGVAPGHRALAAEVFDHGARIYGNWSANVAAAGARGLAAVAAWLSGLGALEDWLREQPAVVSHRFGPGQLPASPLAETAGHLIVVAGFTDAGDVIVYDPAADSARGEAIRRVYPRADFTRSWGGLAYLVRPDHPEG